MPSYYTKLENFLNNGKNFNKIIFFLVVFLCVVKLPALITTEIQPWDEGMYATRVLSIHAHGDFFDQSSHSVGRFYSGSYPPLLIWIGYLSTLLFGNNPISFKIIPLIFSLLCLILILLIGKKLFDPMTAFFAALIFCSNIVFNVLSKRFQFDIPYIFFILLSFYFLFIFNDTLKSKYLILSGISFGCCLMTKILVGFYIPIIIFLSYFFIKGKVNFKFRDILILTTIGIVIALPWHVYMLLKHGNEFTDYFLKFHVYARAIQGVEMNEKSSGIFFYVNYLLSIIPFSILILFGVVKDFFNHKNLSWKKIFIWVWFITGLTIITLSKTKLETYSLLILMPGCFLIPLFINQIDNYSFNFRIMVIVFTIINLFWFASESIRPELKSFVYSSGNKVLIALAMAVIMIIVFALSKYFVSKVELKKYFFLFILAFFFVLNLYYIFQIPVWENKFEINELKNYIEKSERKSIIYIGPEAERNPQFSYYFNGLDIGWENKEYDFVFLDSKEPLEVIKDNLNKLDKSKYIILIEKDGIQRAAYPETNLFMPKDMTFIKKSTGYELYEN